MQYALGAPQHRYQSEQGSRKTLGDPHTESCRNHGNQQGGVRGKREASCQAEEVLQAMVQMFDRLEFLLRTIQWQVWL